jgi:UDP-N-acetylglucosamine:LPS N-acetylglucosamine transferase
MALPNRQVRQYTARQGLRGTQPSLISGAGGRAAGPPGLRARPIGVGQRLKTSLGTAPSLFEGV